MGPVYLASFVVGLGILLVQVLLGAKGADAHADGHVGADHHLDDGGHGKHVEGASSDVMALFLSTRFWIFAALAFGLSGSLIHFLALAGTVATALVAGGAGIASGLFAALAFRTVRRGSLSTTTGASDAVGQIGRVLVACARGQVGQVRVELRGQSVDFLATTDDDEIARGAEVLVVEVRGSVLNVAKRPPELT